MARVRAGVGMTAMGMVALALAACGGGGGSSMPPTQSSSPPPPTQYSIGGTVSGLTGTGLVLQDNGGDNLSVSQNGAFTFATKVNSGAAYSVTVMTQPSGQTCTVANGSGTASANVTNVAVSCTATTAATVTIGGTVTGLSGTGLVLQDNGGDNLTVSQNGTFTFATALATGTAYAVTVATQPTSPSQTCTVTNGTGTTASSNVTNVTVSCPGKFAYVANNGDGTIDAYTIDPTSGALNSVGSPVADGNNPAAVSLAPNGKFAFSASDNGTKIQAFTIQTTGALALVGTYSTGFVLGSAYPDIAVDAQSAHLYIASAGDNEVAGFAINPDGSLTALPNSPYAAGSGAGSIPAFSPDGKYLYVMDQNPTTAGGVVGNAVSGYLIGTDGSLTPLPGSPYAAGTGPTWISFTPDGKFAYVSDSGQDAISAYSVSAGVLTPLTPTAMFTTDEHPQDLTIDATGTHLYAPVANGSTAGAIDVFTINADGSLGNLTSTPAGVTPYFLDIDPAAPFAYVADKGGAEVYGYSINSSTGALTALPNGPFSTGAGSLPQFITIDPSGQFGYTANEGTGNISQFSVDLSTGTLTPIGTGVVPAGLKPIFVSISPEAPGIRD
ncbi:MAG TPA: beta-propeller fold lactonase family protein [Steroidobacteraceae bacterium]|nr:beta-propeller fold lactonase family protein [Steroidobacteraceae bacterium]